MNRVRKDSPQGSSKDAPFQVTYKREEVAQLATEIYDETIAEVHLSLFIDWILQSDENCKEAREHIRELGLDQGYRTDRESNAVLRKLLEGTRQARPRYADELAYPNLGPLSRSPKEIQPLQRALSALSPHTWPRLSKSPFSPVDASDAQPTRPPNFWRRGILRRSGTESSTPLQPTISWPIKSKSDPLMGAETTPSSASFAESFESTRRDTLPPATPDRPAPLNIRSRGSSVAHTTPSVRSTPAFSLMGGHDPLGYIPQITTPNAQRLRTLENAARQIQTPNTPFRRLQIARSASTPSPKNGLSYRKLRPSSTSSLTDSNAENVTDTSLDGIYSYSTAKDHVSSPAEVAEREIYAMLRNVSCPVAQSPSMLMEDEETETESTSSTSQNPFSDPDQKDRLSPTQPYGICQRDTCTDGDCPSVRGEVLYESEDCGDDATDNDVFRSTSEDEAPVTDRTIRPGSQEYSLPSPRLRPQPLAAKPQLTTTGGLCKAGGNSLPDIQYCVGAAEPVLIISERRVSGQSHRSARVENPIAAGSFFNRSLPLRNYEPSLRRSNSTTTSPACGGRVVLVEGLGQMSRRIGPSNLELRPRSTSARRSSRTSQISLALSESPTLIEAHSPATLPVPGADAYKSATSTYVLELLRKTRARAELLPKVNKRRMTISETIWRDQNEALIMAIYGMKDIVISQPEMDFVNRVGKELRFGVGSIDGYEWVGELFTP